MKWLVWLEPLTVLNGFSIEIAGLAGPSHSFEYFYNSIEMAGLAGPSHSFE